ncbi:nucleotide exchange factor GrpE [Aurantibacillus circumpalustris]|uniref:nucleotide exchange factor GrpE n=1 Tax=Aurantibacillus circumpalustris TaxID=3036359 RepID=UPI00295AD68D|nr:nucleotide exchange factor GrpE [Aurantibacillus circumpalustris]
MQNQEDNIINEHSETDSKANTTDNTAENEPVTDETSVSIDFEAKIAEANEKYLRLYSEFDNYRKRTIKEKSEIIKTAAEDLFKAILPVIDDFDRAMKANESVHDSKVIKEGIQLIYNKLKNVTQQKGLVSFETKGETFDPDFMEAITNIPATDESQKGKVIDEVEKGYKLGDKVIRFSKVVIAQ